MMLLNTCIPQIWSLTNWNNAILFAGSQCIVQRACIIIKYVIVFILTGQHVTEPHREAPTPTRMTRTTETSKTTDRTTTTTTGISSSTTTGTSSSSTTGTTTTTGSSQTSTHTEVLLEHIHGQGKFMHACLFLY